MKLFAGEEMLWESSNKDHVLTTHRIREIDKSLFGSTIKSIMLEELTSCELRTNMSYGYLRKAVVYFLLLNGSVYLLNQYLFKSELIQLFFGDDVHLGETWTSIIFYASLMVGAYFVIRFFLSIKRVFSFYAVHSAIDLQIRWIDFEERESFISNVEEAKNTRMERIHGSKP